MLACSVAQSCLTLCKPMNCNPPCSTVHGASHDKNTGVGCHYSSGSSWPRDWTPISCVFCIGRWILFFFPPIQFNIVYSWPGGATQADQGRYKFMEAWEWGMLSLPSPPEPFLQHLSTVFCLLPVQAEHSSGKPSSSFDPTCIINSWASCAVCPVAVSTCRLAALWGVLGGESSQDRWILYHWAPHGKPEASRILSLFKGQLASNLSSICYLIPLCHATYQIYRFQGLGCGNLWGGSLFSPPYTHTHTHTQRNSKDIYHIINSRWLSCGILFFIFLLFRFSVVNTNTKCLINAFFFYCKTKLNYILLLIYWNFSRKISSIEVYNLSI